MRHLLLLILILQCGFAFSQSEENFSCELAIDLSLGDNCFVHSNSESTTESVSSCSENLSKDIWYHFEATQNSLVSLEAKLSVMDSMYNNVITVYSGTCGGLIEVLCINNDEHGFVGEMGYWTTTQSTNYYIRLSGIDDEFGRVSGLSCIALNPEDDTPEVPANDLCDSATELIFNGEWETYNNNDATHDGQYISSLGRNRADVWFSFDSNVDADINIETIASFSHTVALYQGSCDNLSLIGSNLNGSDLAVNNILAEQQYYIQVSGAFASLEGDVDIRVSSVQNENIDNENCVSSESYLGSCHTFSTLSSSFSGQYPSCMFYPQNDIWFDYIPTQSGTHMLSVKTDFLTAVAIYRNNCDDLEEITCGSASACDGALEVNNLIANQQYLIQILTSNEYFINQGGQGCLEIEHISDYSFAPLDLEVSTICISEEVAKLKVEIKNGDGNYIYNGNVDGEELFIGATYFVQVTDQSGCQRIEQGIVSCSQANNECELFYDVELTEFNCSTQTGGSALLTVYSDQDYSASWSSGSTTNGESNLQPGQYLVDIINNTTGVSCVHAFEILEQVESYQIYYEDQDNDGFGDPASFVETCTQPENYVLDFSDCDDTNPAINFSETEIPYNGIDDDCDASTLDDDLDQDGYALADDCDDGNAEINSSEIEIPYNGIDDDCDASTLDDDLDQDGFVFAEDCDDANAEINSSQTEIPYNGIDDDCDANTLDDDLDQDGYALADDCDDENAEINSSETEIPYNGIDDDCDANTLDDDLDQDGYILADDCDDANAEVNSNQTEIPYNGIDDDCDALTLDDDLDQDGFLLVDDCDDSDSEINPDAEEIPDNDIDENCDGDVILTSTTDFINGNINVYPNPTSDRLTVSGVEDYNFKMNLYNLTGELVIENINTRTFSVGHLVSGTYLLRVADLDTGTFIVEKIFVL